MVDSKELKKVISSIGVGGPGTGFQKIAFQASP